jgi:hypothetical protein
MTEGIEDTMRLVAPTVPTWAVRLAEREAMRAGVPARQSSLVLFALGRLIGIPDDKLADFTDTRARKPVESLDEFLESLNGDLDAR